MEVCKPVTDISWDRALYMESDFAVAKLMGCASPQHIHKPLSMIVHMDPSDP